MMDPTSRGDIIAEQVRSWYEANRESWFDRHWPFGTNRKNGSETADNFMLRFISAVYKADEETPA